jgi:hypothetical protein
MVEQVWDDVVAHKAGKSHKVKDDAKPELPSRAKLPVRPLLAV